MRGTIADVSDTQLLRWRQSATPDGYEILVYTLFTTDQYVRMNAV